MRLLHIVSFVAIGSSCIANAFTINNNSNNNISRSISTSITAPIRQESILYCSNDESNLKMVENVISDMHESGYSFRIVVVGNGAILETTSKLGPTMKSSISPKTGGKLITLASGDQSFEFHVKVDEVDKVVFVQSARPIEGGEKILRICRFMNVEGGSICSLILNEYGQGAIDWFSEMEGRYGN